MWFVIHVKPGTEAQAVSLLKSTSKSDGLEEVFCPMVEYLRKDHGKVLPAVEPMLDGCVFVVAPGTWELRACMKRATELETLYDRHPSYEPLEEGEECFINTWAAPARRMCAQSEGEVDKTGHMTITGGPLCGREAEIAKYSRGRRWAILDTRIAGKPMRAHLGVRVVRNDSPNYRKQVQGRKGTSLPLGEVR